MILVTLLLVASLVALARGHRKLHGRLNLLFFILTLAAVLGFEVVIRFVNPGAFDYIKGNEALNRALLVHLCFSVPALLLMPVMLYTGLSRWRAAHVALACLFAVAWAGTFVTGVFFLPVASDG
ncbi:MAG: DUF420 domain-containing protein [Gemmataceae bacterium]|nr:DUF420 domain-containing protein [Gemmataceae bacterium]